MGRLLLVPVSIIAKAGSRTQPNFSNRRDSSAENKSRTAREAMPGDRIFSQLHSPQRGLTQYVQPQPLTNLAVIQRQCEARKRCKYLHRGRTRLTIASCESTARSLPPESCMMSDWLMHRPTVFRGSACLRQTQSASVSSVTAYSSITPKAGLFFEEVRLV